MNLEKAKRFGIANFVFVFGALFLFSACNVTEQIDSRSKKSTTAAGASLSTDAVEEKICAPDVIDDEGNGSGSGSGSGEGGDVTPVYGLGKSTPTQKCAEKCVLPAGASQLADELKQVKIAAEAAEAAVDRARQALFQYWLDNNRTLPWGARFESLIRAFNEANRALMAFSPRIHSLQFRLAAMLPKTCNLFDDLLKFSIRTGSWLGHFCARLTPIVGPIMCFLDSESSANANDNPAGVCAEKFTKFLLAQDEVAQYCGGDVERNWGYPPTCTGCERDQATRDRFELETGMCTMKLRHLNDAKDSMMHYCRPDPNGDSATDSSNDSKN